MDNHYLVFLVVVYNKILSTLEKMMKSSDKKYLKRDALTRKNGTGFKFHPQKAEPEHRVTYLPYSIHLGKKNIVESHLKVRSSQYEVYKCVRIL